MPYPPSGSPRRRKILILPIVIALAVILFQYMTADRFVNPETGQAARVSLSPDQELALGLQSYQEVLSQSKVVRSGPQYDQVRRVAERLIPVIKPSESKFEWEVSLIQDDQANAFCLPGGKIAVYTGILPITQTDAGLATVMGHEIAHATSRHGAQRMFQQQAVQTALMGVSGSVADLDPEQRKTVLGLFGAGANFGVLLPFSRDHETEADEIGLLYMARAGYDPHEAVGFWQRMEQNSGGGQPPEWMSTHPAHGSRIDQLNAFMPKAMEEYHAAVAREGAAPQ